MTEVFQLIYVSSAKDGFEAPALAAMLRGSRARNKRRGITGVLLYHDRGFLQVLEGEKATVEGLYASIEVDPRHLAVTPVWRGHVEKREFPEFSMGFSDCMDPAFADLEGRSELLLQNLPTGAIATGSPAHHFIRVFRKVNRIDV